MTTNSIFILIASAISHHDNLEFLEDTVPRTIPYKLALAKAKTIQAQLRGENVTADEGLQSMQQPARTNGDSTVPSTEEVDSFETLLRIDDRPDDPNEQLELEMRQAAAEPEPTENDIGMSG